jgi:hypothetical protein
VLTTTVAADDPSGCTRFAVTVTPAAIAPRAVARSVGDVVAPWIGGHRHDEVVLAVHDALVDATRRDPHDPVTIRVRQHADHVDVEVIDRDVTLPDGGHLPVARTLCEDLADEVTAEGHLVRLTYRCEAS